VEWVNITAKSLPEAIDLALDNLGVDEAEAEIVVLEEPRQGLFGRVRGTARVKARVKPRSTRPKIERGRNRRRRSGSGSADREGAERSSQGRGERSRTRSRGKKRGGDATDNDNGQAAEKPAREPRAEDRGSREGSRNGSGSSGNRSSKKQRREETPVEEASMEEVGVQLETFLSGLTEAFGFDASVAITEDDEGDGLLAMVEGRYGLMVGPKGRTLDAIQELARVSAQRTAPSSVRIKIDVGGYRQRRQAALVAFALEAAEAAREDGKERSLEPMSSADRRIVHDALSDVAGIETRSAGAEPRRRVIVVPTEGGSAPEESEGEPGADEVAVAPGDGAPVGDSSDVAEGAEVVGN
jgi:spoIIIJ-associated protein